MIVSRTIMEWQEIKLKEMALNAKEKRAIKECGITKVKIIRIPYNTNPPYDPDRLLEGENLGGEVVRGWWDEGDPIQDIRWATKNVDGWPNKLK